MIKVGDPVLLVLRGEFGAGLVEAHVIDVFQSYGGDMSIDTRGDGNSWAIHSIDREGTTWCRGHDRNTPEAQALAVVVALR